MAGVIDRAQMLSQITHQFKGEFRPPFHLPDRAMNANYRTKISVPALDSQYYWIKAKCLTRIQTSMG